MVRFCDADGAPGAEPAAVLARASADPAGGLAAGLPESRGVPRVWHSRAESDAAPGDERGAAPRTAAELVKGLDVTWNMMADRLARWSDADMRETFQDDWDGEIVQLSRAWIVWHVMEHDLHHGGEVSLTLGMHGIPAQFPG